jgi:hypothetical protein
MIQIIDNYMIFDRYLYLPKDHAMKLFHQLSLVEQEAALNHCINLVIQNTIENGLHLETTDDADGQELKEHLHGLMDELAKGSFPSSSEQIAFLMSDSIFSDTVSELAIEMSRNAFYHDSTELVIFTDHLVENDEFVEEMFEDSEESLIELPSISPKKKNNLLN